MAPSLSKIFSLGWETISGIQLFSKIKRYQKISCEANEVRVTEKELENLHHKIDKLLAKIEDKDSATTPETSETPNVSTETEEECVICMSAKASMQTYPCGHKVICRKCFIKTIQVAVSQRCLPLKCVICRTRILNLRQSPAVKIATSKRPRPKLGGPRFGKHSKVYVK